MERDLATYKAMYEEVSRERNAWISEYRAARAEVERVKQQHDDFKNAFDLLVVEKCELEEWLSNYRDDIKKDPNYRINRDYMIEAINEILNGTD